MKSPTARWLSLFVVLILGIATSVAAIRGSDDDDGGRPDRSAEVAAAPVPTTAPPSAVQEPAIAPAPPQAETPAPVVRLGDRTSLPARTAKAAKPSVPPPAITGSPSVSAASAPPSSARSEQASAAGAPPPAPEGPQPGHSPPPPAPPGADRPTPPNPDLISGTLEVNFGQARLLVHVVPAPNPDLDVTVGETPVVGNSPPAERTGFSIGGSLAPGDSVPRPAAPGAAPGLGLLAPGWVAI